MEKASGAVIVSMARITYRSAISKISPKTLNMIMMSKIITNSHAAVSAPKTLSSTSATLTASGISSKLIMFDVRFNPISHICGLASSKNAKTKVLANRILGSSPSKPRPDAMLLSAWNTRLPISSAQPTARRICIMSPMTGTWVFK